MHDKRLEGFWIKTLGDAGDRSNATRKKWTGFFNDFRNGKRGDGYKYIECSVEDGGDIACCRDMFWKPMSGKVFCITAVHPEILLDVGFNAVKADWALMSCKIECKGRSHISGTKDRDRSFIHGQDCKRNTPPTHAPPKWR